MIRIEFIPGTDGPQVRVVGRLQGGVLDLTQVSEIDAAAKQTLVQPVICPGWLAHWVEGERARLAAEDAACERPSLAVPAP